MPSKLSRFWYELKRRRVHRLMAIYAGSAYVIFEASTLIFPRWGLPDWTIDLVLYLLILGAIVTFIMGWIYDLTPDGIQKTGPVSETSTKEAPPTPNGWKIASYISLVVIVLLVVLNIIPRKGKSEIIDKSIAVLPFINDSEDLGNEHIINGIMEDLLINLQSIKDLRVPGRTSTEQYRNNPKPIPEIAAEMKVAYLLEGSGQRYGDMIRLRVQLVEGVTDKHVWAASYNEVISGPEDIFRIQSAIAQSIAAELQAVITPSEKELIEKIPTTSISAFDLYQQGNEEYWSYWSRRSGEEALERAEHFFDEALKYDSTFAQAYTGLARIYWGSEGYLSENYLDTVRVLLDKALFFDTRLAEAHTLNARYYHARNDTKRAMREVNNAIALNPNDWEAYNVKATISPGYINTISNRQNAVLLNRGPELPGLLESLGYSYCEIGFLEKASDIFEGVLKLTGDSIEYLFELAYIEMYRGNFNRAAEYIKQSLALDSTHLALYGIIFKLYHYLGEIEHALEHGKIWVEGMEESGGLWLNFTHFAGIYYRLKGLEEKAEYYFDLQMEYCNRSIELDNPYAQGGLAYFDIASVYAFRGEKEKAYENLRVINLKENIGLWMLMRIKSDPLFDSIRDEPEFKQILQDVEFKYQAEHDRVRQWLEENDML